jgi:hypothetical protein
MDLNVEKLPPEPVARLPQDITCQGDFQAWAREAKPGAFKVYFIGELSFFRQWAPLFIIRMQAKSDTAGNFAPRPAREAVLIEHLQSMLAIVASASSMQRSGILHLIQRRRKDGLIEYCATRTGRR